MSAIYISYRHLDKTHAISIVNRLEKLGYKNIFIDIHESKGFVGGSNWTQVLFDRMTECEIFMPIISRNWLDSKWVFAELYLAKYLKKKLLPVAVEPVPMQTLPLGLSEFMAIDLHSDFETGLNSLDYALRALGIDPRTGFKFKAFLSYSREDAHEVEEIREALTKFSYPESIRGRRTSLGVVPSNLGSIFRDKEHLGAEQSLSDGLKRALRDSEFLIVICSPSAANSKWVNEEVRQFLELRESRNVLAVLIDGTKHGLHNSFPSALKTEPLAPDLKYHGLDGVIVRLAATISGIPFEELKSAQKKTKGGWKFWPSKNIL